MAKDFYKILGLKRKDKPSGDEIKKVGLISAYATPHPTL